MQSWSLIIFVPLVYSERITDEENEKIRQDCGAHFLQSSSDSPLSNSALLEHRALSIAEGRQIRSFDGYKARPYEYPFMAAFKVYKDYDKRTSGCTAVQISPRHLLTAAHCVIQKIHYWQKYCEAGKEREYFIFWGIPPEYFYIFVGAICTHPELCPQTSMFKAKEITYHEDYNPCTRENDIAVIELSEEIPRARGTPICMPGEYEPLDTTLTAVGYGLDPRTPSPSFLFNWLQAVDLSLKEVAFSRKIIRTKTPRRSTCTGDSGGPLIRTNEEGKHILVGITSSMKPHCEVSTERIYDRDNFFADVRAYVHWICEVTGVCPERRQSKGSAK